MWRDRTMQYTGQWELKIWQSIAFGDCRWNCQNYKLTFCVCVCVCVYYETTPWACKLAPNLNHASILYSPVLDIITKFIIPANILDTLYCNNIIIIMCSNWLTCSLTLMCGCLSRSLAMPACPLLAARMRGVFPL